MLNTDTERSIKKKVKFDFLFNYYKNIVKRITKERLLKKFAKIVTRLLKIAGEIKRNIFVKKITKKGKREIFHLIWETKYGSSRNQIKE